MCVCLFRRRLAQLALISERSDCPQISGEKYVGSAADMWSMGVIVISFFFLAEVNRPEVEGVSLEHVYGSAGDFVRHGLWVPAVRSRLDRSSIQKNPTTKVMWLRLPPQPPPLSHTYTYTHTTFSVPCASPGASCQFSSPANKHHPLSSSNIDHDNTSSHHTTRLLEGICRPSTFRRNRGTSSIVPPPPHPYHHHNYHLPRPAHTKYISH